MLWLGRGAGRSGSPLLAWWLLPWLLAEWPNYYATLLLAGVVVVYQRWPWAGVGLVVLTALNMWLADYAAVSCMPVWLGIPKRLYPVVTSAVLLVWAYCSVPGAGQPETIRNSAPQAAE